MSYITDRLIAMSFPSQNIRAVYRNPLWQVRRVLDIKHSSFYKVYNLCAEETYDPGYFHGRVEVIPFDDNHVPPLSLIKLFCESVHAWLSSDSRNVAVIHCMAGKGRTGLMVCAYLVYMGTPVEEALQLYADRRSYVNEGVTIASQRRYVGYWSKTVVFRNGNTTPPEVLLPAPKSRELQRIRLYDTLCSNPVQFVIQEIREKSGQLYQPAVEVVRDYCRKVQKGSQKIMNPRYYLSFLHNDNDEKKKDEEQPHFVVQMDTESSIIDKKTCLDYNFDKPLLITGDVRIIFYDKTGYRIFYACFNTAFIVNSILQFSQGELDKVGRKAKSIFGPNFCVELLFGPAVPHHPDVIINVGNLEDSF
ncbi:phosphatidylinositol 3,4,5-trisphosphate 3-phosphatase and protein-tyrosine-phosphatase PTEN1 [Cryptomeria japonica]|uniref:phosphatidylinositol 3,4,5-trisphosphate 3-phosphatase and protein-tyrosine-phosphatase PTEN1 n=1 Tax=Cryptomeria japonica TaxID=3369 RepID=UPI0027DA732E|nr:phosphatidylinositol 3,4,5-trisphosphate 3-phosphatase and protein-tyrosine-phosphatase PTEN1 [Cryptomeria japonica]